ncbi:MAG: hypothetical protein HY791_05440 [Deltaproteobacteria bacterium]|nr:hypothetical protein [Deltaproteobacteria bacterium]
MVAMLVVFIISLLIAPVSMAFSVRRRVRFLRRQREIATSSALKRYQALASSDSRLAYRSIVCLAISSAAVPLGFLAPWEWLAEALLAWTGGLLAGYFVALPLAISGMILDRRVWRMPVGPGCRREFDAITRQWRTSMRPVDPPIFIKSQRADHGQLSMGNSGMLSRAECPADTPERSPSDGD